MTDLATLYAAARDADNAWHDAMVGLWGDDAAVDYRYHCYCNGFRSRFEKRRGVVPQHIHDLKTERDRASDAYWQAVAAARA